VGRGIGRGESEGKGEKKKKRKHKQTSCGEFNRTFSLLRAVSAQPNQSHVTVRLVSEPSLTCQCSTQSSAEQRRAGQPTLRSALLQLYPFFFLSCLLLVAPSFSPPHLHYLTFSVATIPGPSDAPHQIILDPPWHHHCRHPRPASGTTSGTPSTSLLILSPLHSLTRSWTAPPLLQTLQHRQYNRNNHRNSNSTGKRSTLQTQARLKSSGTNYTEETKDRPHRQR